jgi:hypothetical protein
MIFFKTFYLPLHHFCYNYLFFILFFLIYWLFSFIYDCFVVRPYDFVGWSFIRKLYCKH